MTLKRKIAKLEDVDEALRGLYTKAKEGDGFVLDAEADPDEGKLSEFRENNRKMNAELERWKALGLTPEQAAEKIRADRKAADDAENAKLSAAQLKEKYEKQLSEKDAEWQKKFDALQSKLDGHEVRGPIRQALLAKGAIAGDVDDLIDSLERRGRFKRGDDGKLVFLDEQGDAILGMSTEKFAEKVRTERARWFEPVKPGGAGTKPSDARPAGDSKVVSIDDQAALSANLEDIAAGKVTVTESSAV